MPALLPRRRGLSVRLRLTLSYAGFLLLAGALLLAVVWVFLLRYVPDGTIITAGPHVPNRGDLQRAFIPRALWAMAFLLVLGLVGGWFLAGRMLAPLRRITGAVRLADAGSLAHRIALPGPRDEFRELADAFDAMLERVETHVGEQSRFAANASHELRTPLATARALLEVARQDPAADVPALLARLEATTARASALAESLLLLSRVESTALRTEPTDLSLAVEDAAETLLVRAEARGVTVRTDAAPVLVDGNPELLAQLVVNLVHNGIVHNLPADGEVQVRLRADGSRALLQVESTGAVLDEAILSQLTEPFVRGAGRTHADPGAGAHAGLGLAIVRSIVEAHGGALALRSRAGGGLRVEIVLPLAAGVGSAGAGPR
ncbi:sensor histidine kinase [Brachybacterium hainanense]|uniref:histidine kinase n=1 Tax=Brachybacterium hainanense TaxID=1541174 RepID=A0ABV6RAQ8_9MICO